MDDIQKQVVERLKQANNILVTVRNNPSIDLLSACIALALVLDKMDKHAAAVFSGQVPSAMEFLKPEDTIERTPDSLRDFIIALDKAKADKLRYKVEDTVVRIFITPYKTSLSEKDLEFSQGDFNVDAVVALGAHEQEELDQAITAHGRILHDAAIISINNTPNGNLGSLHWQDIGASSISEMVTRLAKDMGSDVLDGQIATALLTGIVAETARFSNDKTTPETMNIAGELMAAGANQQLVANSLQPAQQPAASAQPDTPAADATPAVRVADDGTLDIDHAGEEEAEHKPEEKAEPTEPELTEPETEEHHEHELLPMQEPPHISKVHGTPLPNVPYETEYDEEEIPSSTARSYLVDDSQAPAGMPKSESYHTEPSTSNPFDIPASTSPEPLIDRDSPMPNATPPLTFPLPPSAPDSASASLPPVQQPFTPPSQPLDPASVPPPMSAPLAQPLPSQPYPQSSLQVTPLPPLQQPAAIPAVPPHNDGQTLEEIEESVHSPHADHRGFDLDAVRSQVANALQQTAAPSLEPLQSLNANPLGGELHSHEQTSSPTASPLTPNPESVPIEVDPDGNLKVVSAQSSAAQSAGMPLPSIQPTQPVMPLEPPAANPASSPSPTLPPPGPPPISPPGLGTPAA